MIDSSLSEPQQKELIPAGEEMADSKLAETEYGDAVLVQTSPDRVEVEEEIFAVEESQVTLDEEKVPLVEVSQETEQTAMLELPQEEITRVIEQVPDRFVEASDQEFVPELTEDITIDKDTQQVLKSDEEMLLSKPEERLPTLEASESSLQVEDRAVLVDERSESSLLIPTDEPVMLEQPQIVEEEAHPEVVEQERLSLTSYELDEEEEARMIDSSLSEPQQKELIPSWRGNGGFRIG